MVSVSATLILLALTMMYKWSIRNVYRSELCLGSRGVKEHKEVSECICEDIKEVKVWSPAFVA
jgi:hypothetical protein